jgi:hypothetical protein
MKLATLAAAAALSTIFAGPATAESLGQKALKQLFPGRFHAVVSGLMNLKVTARSDGTLIAFLDSKKDTGSWSVKNGNLCIRLERWTGGRFNCSPVTQNGDWYHASSVKFRKI